MSGVVVVSGWLPGVVKRVPQGLSRWRPASLIEHLRPWSPVNCHIPYTAASSKIPVIFQFLSIAKTISKLWGGVVLILQLAWDESIGGPFVLSAV